MDFNILNSRNFIQNIPYGAQSGNHSATAPYTHSQCLSPTTGFSFLINTLNMSKIKRDINQQDLKIFTLHFVKSE